jgi:hypothetical protein
MNRRLHFDDAAGAASRSAAGKQARASFPVETTIGRQKNKTNGKTMSKQIKSYNAEYLIKNDMPKVRTLNMQLAVTDRDLGEEIRRVFELEKSSGQELNLTFSCETS